MQLARWLTVRDCADRLHTSPDKILAEIKAGRLRARRNGSPARPMYRIPEADFEAYVAAHWQHAAVSAA